MIEENRVHGLADGVVATEGKRQVTDTAAGLGIRQVFLDPSDSTDEVAPIIGMLADTRSDR